MSILEEARVFLVMYFYFKFEVLNVYIGQSYEGRDMNVLAITKAGPGAPNIWLEVMIQRYAINTVS